LIIKSFSLTIARREDWARETKQFGEEIGMDQRRIQQVLDIEKKAEEIHQAALKEAQQLPVMAEQEAQALIEKTKAEAQQQAREIVSGVKADEESAHILSEIEEKNKQLDALATQNFDRAVNFVLERVIGRA
jgi:vacuolar-type H+-ATPase subunit H